MSAEIKVGDWVKVKLTHKFITKHIEWIGIVTHILNEELIHVTCPVYDITKVAFKKNVLEHKVVYTQ